MTGFGEAHASQDGLSIGVEVRSINSRYFKLNLRSNDSYGSLEPNIESLLRETVKRGTVNVSLQIDRAPRAEDYRLNLTALDAYRQQLNQFYQKYHLPEVVSPDKLLLLPGVVSDRDVRKTNCDEDWPRIEPVLRQAIERLAAMRAQEGAAMARDMAANCTAISTELTSIESRAPLVIDGYRIRLEERLKKILTEFEVSLSATDLVREVSIFTERSDISEEIVRLRSHLEQFQQTLDLAESSGRKLEFVLQEMFREINTIGSKANDIEISQHVVEIKAAIERLREMVQNVE